MFRAHGKSTSGLRVEAACAANVARRAAVRPTTDSDVHVMRMRIEIERSQRPFLESAKFPGHLINSVGMTHFLQL